MKDQRKQVFNSIERILQVFAKSKGTIKPHFILTGPTGSSKTYTVETLCDTLGINLINVNSAQLTVEGVAGNSVSKSLAQLKESNGRPTVVLFDEFDKLLNLGEGSNSISDDITVNVQNEILKVLEGGTTEVFGNYGKYDKVSCDKVLYIFAGAFGGKEITGLPSFLEFGVKPELLGRIGLHYHLDRITLEEMQELLNKSDLLRKYTDLMSGADPEDALDTIREELNVQYDNNILGVRLINTLVHQYFIDRKFTRVTKVGESESANPDRKISFNLAM